MASKACATSEPPPGSRALAGSIAQTGAAAAPADAGVTGDADAGSQARRCRGAGRYESGKEGSYLPCCDGLHEVFYSLPAESDGGRVCINPPLRVYACVRGECGDGICEEGEAPACGCTSDCPQAEWAGSSDDEGDAGAGGDTANVGFPESCEMEELVHFLQTSEAPVACGDLPLGAGDAVEAAALDCLREAIDNEQPFRLFWHSQGTDSIGGAARTSSRARFTTSSIARSPA